MTVSKRWTSDPKNIEDVVRLYRQENPLLTQQEIAQVLNSTPHNVAHVAKQYFSKEERQMLKSVRIAAKKFGDLNPMKGRTGKDHPNYVGDCETGRGYMTRMHNGKRQLVHRVIMAQALGLEELPRQFHVHHINGDGTDNHIDNLALVTHQGHFDIHALQVRDGKALTHRKYRLGEFLEFTT